MQSRLLKPLGQELSVLGMGGIVVCEIEQPLADRRVKESIARGVTYFDVAPQYADAQQRLGPALEPFRDQVTLACKSLERSAKGVRREMADSLEKLRTDHFDIYQLHAMHTEEDLDRALADDGALRAVLDAKEAGTVRCAGFSAHDEDTALRLIDTGHFDTMLVPLNFRSYTQARFGPRMLAAANDAGIGVLALKAMAQARVQPGEARPYPKCWYAPEDDPHTCALQLRWALALPGVVAALPPGDSKLYHLALDLAQQHDLTQPLTEAELHDLQQRTAHQAPLFPLPGVLG